MKRIFVTLGLTALAVMAGACSSGPTGPGDGGPGGDPPPVTLDSADLRVVFVGNSLTYTNDIPGIVQDLADEAGLSMAHATLAQPNASLQDHWAFGTQDILRELKADVVVMQQGPSSLPENRAHLAEWAGRFAAVIREAGGEPALYMVWPSYTWFHSFPDVYTSYEQAAQAVNGLFIPAGQTWLEAWELDPNLALYGPDNFHPSYLGSLAAAQTIFAVLFDVPAESVPALTDDADESTEETLRAALAESLRLAGYGGE